MTLLFLSRKLYSCLTFRHISVTSPHWLADQKTYCKKVKAFHFYVHCPISLKIPKIYCNVVFPIFYSNKSHLSAAFHHISGVSGALYHKFPHPDPDLCRLTAGNIKSAFFLQERQHFSPGLKLRLTRLFFLGFPTLLIACRRNCHRAADHIAEAVRQ